MVLRLSDLVSSQTPYDVCGMGSAIVDIIAESDDSFLQTHHIQKGTMTLVDEARADFLYGRIGPAVEMSGGSVANTVAGIAALGGKPAFIGKVRNDQLGSIFRHDLRSLGVHYSTPPATQGPATGRCLILVTPDAQRSMSTYLGVNTETSEADNDAAVIEQSKITFLEGYLFDMPPAQAALRSAARTARTAGRHVALSLSDPFCVERHRDAFRELIKDFVDILIGNEHELMSLYQLPSFEEAMAKAHTECPMVIGTRSAAGALIACQSTLVKIAAEPAHVVDTTGAGDLFAAGFLYGLTHGLDLATSGRLGAILAAEIISHYGPRPQRSLKEVVREKGVEIGG
jgi:sugar/nucleoside kinase (ribokinase family)